MDDRSFNTCTAFAGSRRIAAGSVLDVALQVKAALNAGESAAVLVFDDRSSMPIDLDLRGDARALRRRYSLADSEAHEAEPAAVATALTDAPKRGPGRPKLGVTAREVTLLPRHWDWLAGQPGGASVALRKLVEQARRANAERDRRQQAQEATYRFMVAIAGNAAGFEEAVRALFAADGMAFARCIEAWPIDVRDHASRLAVSVFQQERRSESR